MTLVLHFNSFTGHLLGGYLMRPCAICGEVAPCITHQRLGKDGMPPAVFDRTSAWKHMRASDVLVYMMAHPDARCEPVKV